MDKRNFSAACPKLQESERLDPGGGTLLNLALCHEQEGRAATAWAEFIEALGIAKRDHRGARIQFAEEHIRGLEPSLSRMTLVVAAADEPALELRTDGALVGRAAWGMAFPVDPGDHTVEASAPGKLPWRTTVTVGARGQATAVSVQVPPLVHSSAAMSPQSGALGTEGGERSGGRRASTPQPSHTEVGGRQDGVAEPGSVEPSRDGQASAARHAWGLASLAVGVAGLGAGSILGIIAQSNQNKSTERCPHDPCDTEAVRLSQSAGRAADWATVGFAVGLSSAAVGTYLLLTGGSTDHASVGERSKRVEWAIRPDPRSHGASVSVSGLF